MTSEPGAVLAAEPEDMARTAMERSKLYGFLATIFKQEPTPSLIAELKRPEVLAALSAAGAELGDDFLERPEDKLLNELEVEYARLFIGPGKHISPYASVHLGGAEGALWGESTAHVKRFIQSLGFAFKPDFQGIPDHVSVELELMAALAKAEAEAQAEGDGEQASRAREAQATFLDQHLSKWLPGFCDKVAQAAALPLYREMARVTAGFVDSERKDVLVRRDEATARRAGPASEGAQARADGSSER